MILKKIGKIIIKIFIGILCLFFDFWGLLWIECSVFELFDNPLRYFLPIYLAYILGYFIVFIYQLIVAIMWICGKCKYQIFVVYAFALFGIIVFLFL